MKNKCGKYEFGERVEFAFLILCEMLNFTGVLSGELEENVVNFKWLRWWNFVVFERVWLEGYFSMDW